MHASMLTEKSPKAALKPFFIRVKLHLLKGLKLVGWYCKLNKIIALIALDSLFNKIKLIRPSGLFQGCLNAKRNCAINA